MEILIPILITPSKSFLILWEEGECFLLERGMNLELSYKARIDMLPDRKYNNSKR